MIVEVAVSRFMRIELDDSDLIAGLLRPLKDRPRGGAHLAHADKGERLSLLLLLPMAIGRNREDVIFAGSDGHGVGTVREHQIRGMGNHVGSPQGKGAGGLRKVPGEPS